jgi:hypothetical protein
VEYDGEQTHVWVAGHEAIHERLGEVGRAEEVSAEDVQKLEYLE